MAYGRSGAGAFLTETPTPYVMPSLERLEQAMECALGLAADAALLGEVPVGAVLLAGNTLVASAHNLRETTHDPLAHAELLVLREAALKLGRWRLSGCTLVVTLEPCPMCAGAVVNSRVDGLVFAAADPKAGAVGSLLNLAQDARLNHRAEVVRGVHEERAKALLQSFFVNLRAKRRGLLP